MPCAKRTSHAVSKKDPSCLKPSCKDKSPTCKKSDIRLKSDDCKNPTPCKQSDSCVKSDFHPKEETCDRPCARTYLPTVTNSMKWWLAIFLGILFFIIAFGGTYTLTNALWTGLGLPCYLVAPGCPNVWGVFIHAIIFILIIRLILW